MKRCTGMAASLFMALALAADVCADALVLVENGVSRMPIVIPRDAAPHTRHAARELADYLEKIAGVRPSVVDFDSGSPPASAVWVGYQPILKELFKDLDFDFKHPEEILIAADANHLVIIGRDRWDPKHFTEEIVTSSGRRTIEVQHEYGTANAVYTFLQKYAGVRWLWPGELGEDVPRRSILAFDPFEFRHRPLFRQRAVLCRSTLRARHWEARPGLSADWARKQRLQLDSLQVSGCHAYTDWWERFHATHPDWFALQPDGTRSGYPKPGFAKLCLSNPEVWVQWIRDSEQRLRTNPALSTLPAGENDGYNSGLCVCKNCQAWDHPQGAPWRYRWAGVQREYVAMSDRYVTFFNQLAQLVKTHFPERNELRVVAPAYGPSIPAPVEARLAPNTILSFVGNFPGNRPEIREQQKQHWLEWCPAAPAMFFRPNLWYFAGGNWGLPDITLRETAEDFRFLAEHRCVGIDIDSAGETWATMGPQYYLMAQLAWDPLQDARAVMDDYYRRGFGPAAETIRAYWTHMEMAHDAIVAQPELAASDSRFLHIREVFPRVYDTTFLEQADRKLQDAEALTGNEPGSYAERVAFVRAGFEFTRRMIALIPLMTRVRESPGTNADAVRQALAHWQAIERIEAEAGPFAINLELLRRVLRNSNYYRGGVADYFGPPSDAFQRAAGLLHDKAAEVAEPADLPKESPRPEPIVPQALTGEWMLVFQDTFNRDQLGRDWKVVEGDWSVADGHLSGKGVLLLNRSLSGFQRVEFDAVVEANVFEFLGEKQTADVSDLSVLLQVRSDLPPLEGGYFFQFGGQWNTRNRLVRNGDTLREDDRPAIRIVPNRSHHLVVENDEGLLRLIVDGNVVLECREDLSFVGEGHDRFGFFFYTLTRVSNVKVSLKPVAADTI